MSTGSRKYRIYLETSVVSYLAARPSSNMEVARRQDLTAAWWRQRAEYDLLISDVVLSELMAGDATAARKRLEFVTDISLVESSDQARLLAEEMIAAGLFPKVAGNDALHLCVAMEEECDFVLTWNYRHLSNLQVRRRLDLFCRERRLWHVTIGTPEEWKMPDE